MAGCFDGVLMGDRSSRLIVRVLKSFSVRFVSDWAAQAYAAYRLRVAEMAVARNLTVGEVHASRLVPGPSGAESGGEGGRSWVLSTGQLVFDIKSTHLVKFEEYAFADMRVEAGARFYLDMDLIEKLMVKRYAFLNMNIGKSWAFVSWFRGELVNFEMIEALRRSF